MKTALALGTFDGLHIAHRKVLELPNEYIKTAVTFYMPPKMYFKGENELLMTFETKVELLKKMGFSEIVALDFKAVKDTEPKDFLDFLVGTYKPSLISCGFNYKFGKNGIGDTEFIKNYCLKNGIQYKVCEEVKHDGISVSSTLIRNMLRDGDVEKANILLYEPFSFVNVVEHGDCRGRTIGFPTINQYYPENLVKVKFGVYKTEVIFDSKIYKGITNIGIRPTFQSDRIISETYIKDFSGNLYGKTVKTVLKEFLREEKKFASLEELKKQIEIDIK